MKFSFAIPVYKDTMMTVKCLETLRQFHPEDEVIINDDGSPPQFQNLLKPICEKYNARLLLNANNYGFSYSVNRMLDAATGDIIILCNNDIEFTQNITDNTHLIFQQDETIGVVGYYLTYKNGAVQHAGHKRVTHKTFGHWYHNEQPNPDCFKNKYIIGVTGALQAIRKSMINKIGVYSPRYHMAYEDVEFCLRTWKNGYKIYYLGDTHAIHNEGMSRGNDEQSKKKTDTFNKEQKSLQQYMEDVKQHDLKMLENEINKLNGVESGKTIVFKRTAALGDCILLTGVIEQYAKEHPQDYIIVTTLFDYPFINNPYIDKVVNKLPEKYDQLFDFDMCYESKPENPIWQAYSNAMGYDNCLPKLYDHYQDGVNLVNLLNKEKINLDAGKWCIINPSQTWKSRMLTEEQWNNINNHLIKLGYNIIIVGTQKDLDLPLQQNIYNLKNKLTLGMIRILMQHVKFYLGLDSGLMHIALTTKTTVIGIFTVAHPETRMFRKEKSLAVIPTSECKFCKNKKQIETVECEKLDCIKSINIEDIYKAIESVK